MDSFAIMNNAPLNKFFCGLMFSFVLGIYLVVKLLGHMVTLYLTFCGTFEVFSEVAILFYIPANYNVWKFQFLHIFTNACYCLYFDYSHSSGCEVVSYCGFDLHFPNSLWCLAFFHVLLGYLYIFFGYSDPLPIFNWVICFFLIELWEFFICLSYQLYDLQIFAVFAVFFPLCGGITWGDSSVHYVNFEISEVIKRVRTLKIDQQLKPSSATY